MGRADENEEKVLFSDRNYSVTLLDLRLIASYLVVPLMFSSSRSRVSLNITR